MIVNERYDLLKFSYTPTNGILSYFEMLYHEGLLADRFTDHDDPTPLDVVDLLGKIGYRFYFVYDRENEEVVGECMLSEPISEVAIIHFSVSPKINPLEARKLMRQTTDEILLHWTKQDTDEPYIKAIIGTTPILNERACLIVQRCGFKYIATVPHAAKYRGEVCPAFLTIKEVKNSI